MTLEEINERQREILSDPAMEIPDDLMAEFDRLQDMANKIDREERSKREAEEKRRNPKKMIKSIIIDPEVPIREIDPYLVKAYAEDIRNYGKQWQKFWKGKILVTESFHLWSGFHTIEAARSVFGERHMIHVRIEGDTKEDAIRLVTGTNATHGYNRTEEEDSKAVLRWLEDERLWDYTNEHIAKYSKTPLFLVNEIDSSLNNPDRPTKRRYRNSWREDVWVETDPVKIAIEEAEEARRNPPPQKQMDFFEVFSQEVLGEKV